MKKYMIICFDPEDESQKAKFFDNFEDVREYLAYTSTDYVYQLYEWSLYNERYLLSFSQG